MTEIDRSSLLSDRRASSGSEKTIMGGSDIRAAAAEALRQKAGGENAAAVKSDTKKAGGENAAAVKSDQKKAGGKSAAAGKAEQRKRRIRKRAALRAVIQLFFFISMPGAFVAGFSGVKYVFQQVSTGSSISMNSFLAALIGLSAFTILFGRFFCGYVCAFGSMGDLMYWLSGLVQKKVFGRKKQISIPESVSGVLRYLKYLNLIVIVVLCAVGLYGELSGTSPWDVFSQLTSLRGVGSTYITGMFYLVLIIAGMWFKERFFCRFLCPMGAFFALLPILPISMLQRKSSQCIKGCNLCKDQCPAGIKLEPDGPKNGECIACEKCVPVCPRGNITHTESKLLKNEYLLILIRAALFFALGCYLGFCRFL